VRRSRLNFIFAIQIILFLAHAVVFATWVSLWDANPADVSRFGIAFGLLSVSFVGASLLAFRYYNLFVRALYTAAAIWLGILNFCVLASLVCWVVYGGERLARVAWPPRDLVLTVFGLAAVLAFYGTANSFVLRVRPLEVSLPNLPDAWRNRVAALVSDTHLGPVRAARFSRRVAKLLNRLRADIVFLTGDFYDGTAADVFKLANPLALLEAPLGAYFVTGNHEEFSNPRQYRDALAKAGVRVLHSEAVNVEGLQIVGISYHELATSERFRDALVRTGLDPAAPSILLVHAPNRLWEAEQAGVSLQLSGHTHQGQFFPWTLAVSRIYGKFAYGLHKLGNMQVYITSGAGTWGPPLRLGTDPEIVLFRFV